VRSTMRHRSIRFADEEWALFVEESIALPEYNGQPSTYAHDCAIAGHHYLKTQRGIGAQVSDARPTRRGTAVPQFREQTDKGGTVSDGAARDMLGAKRWRS